MVTLRKKKVKGAEIPTGSMADIAFLLLLFFLVATTIDVDTGIGLTLPEYQEEQDLVPLSKDRMAALLINENGDVLLNGEVIAIPQIKDNLKERITSKIELPKKKKLVVSVKTDRRTNYNLYIQALDQVKGAFYEVRDEYSNAQFGKKFKDLNEEQAKEVKDKIPIIISIAEPEKIK
jgi:biopolymer transport protein ExbD